MKAKKERKKNSNMKLGITITAIGGSVVNSPGNASPLGSYEDKANDGANEAIEIKGDMNIKEP